MKGLIDFIRGTFEKDSPTSSKRITGVLMIVWALSAGSYYVWKSFHGDADESSKELIEYALATGAVLLGGGTIAEALGTFFKNKNTK